MSKTNRFRDALTKIADAASSVLTDDYEPDHNHGYEAVDGGVVRPNCPGCVIKTLPKRLLVKAAETARSINPVNAPIFGSLMGVDEGYTVDEPLRLALLTSKYWGPTPRTLTVSFMESTATALKTRIISHMNAWTATGCISFVGTNGTGDVRISFGPGGYWSYLGTDITHIPKNRPTMNLEKFSMSTAESEYKRVVRHETGHTLGFPHEHMRKALVARIDPAKAYKWFLQTYGWDKATVDAQVLTSLDEGSLMGTPADQNSIMCYQLPASITKDNKPITGGTDIDATDAAFCGKIYPKAGHAIGSAESLSAADEDWSEAEDVEVTI